MAGAIAVDAHVRRWVPREGALRELRVRLLGRTAGEHSKNRAGDQDHGRGDVTPLFHSEQHSEQIGGRIIREII